MLGLRSARPNLRDGREGPIFRGRFASVAVESDAHLVRASRYIHRNPVEAGLVAEPWDWPWSSARAHVGLDRPPAWLRTDAILEMFGTQHARQEYRDFLRAEIDAETRTGYADWQVAPWGQTRRV